MNIHIVQSSSLPQRFPVNFQFSAEFSYREFGANWWEVALALTQAGICCTEK